MVFIKLRSKVLVFILLLSVGMILGCTSSHVDDDGGDEVAHGLKVKLDMPEELLPDVEMKKIEDHLIVEKVKVDLYQGEEVGQDAIETTEISDLSGNQEFLFENLNAGENYTAQVELQGKIAGEDEVKVLHQGVGTSEVVSADSITTMDIKVKPLPAQSVSVDVNSNANVSQVSLRLPGTEQKVTKEYTDSAYFEQGKDGLNLKPARWIIEVILETGESGTKEVLLLPTQQKEVSLMANQEDGEVELIVDTHKSPAAPTGLFLNVSGDLEWDGPQDIDTYTIFKNSEDDVEGREYVGEVATNSYQNPEPGHHYWVRAYRDGYSSGLSEAFFVAKEDEQVDGVRAFPKLMGFATTGNGTTGGQGGTEVTVTSAEELLEYAQRDEPYIINVKGEIEIIRGIGDYRESQGEYHIFSNTTLRGLGNDAKIKYGGFRVSDAENVIIQNLHFDGTYDSDRDDYKNTPNIGEKTSVNNPIEVTNGSENVWITQNTFERYNDELLSIKREASNVTVSWNVFECPEINYAILIGHSDNHTADRGRLKVTLHHNYFATISRNPRTRYGKFHIFNNYYYNTDEYGVAATQDAEVLLESNYFRDSDKPTRIGYGSSSDGYLVERNNIFENSGKPETNGDVFAVNDYYEYSLDAPENIPGLVIDGAGAWK